MVTAKLPEIIQSVFPEDAREWEILTTTHKGNFTRVTIASKPVEDSSAVVRFIVYNDIVDPEVGDESGELTVLSEGEVDLEIAYVDGEWGTELLTHGAEEGDDHGDDHGDEDGDDHGDEDGDVQGSSSCSLSLIHI